jgi:hypothetical protein
VPARDSGGLDPVGDLLAAVVERGQACTTPNGPRRPYAPPRRSPFANCAAGRPRRRFTPATLLMRDGRARGPPGLKKKLGHPVPNRAGSADNTMDSLWQGHERNGGTVIEVRSIESHTALAKGLYEYAIEHVPWTRFAHTIGGPQHFKAGEPRFRGTRPRLST